MADDTKNDLASRAAIAAGAAIGSAAIAAALLYVRRRNDKKKADAQPGKTGTAPHYPEATD